MTVLEMAIYSSLAGATVSEILFFSDEYEF
jgi:hypothetical protein